MKLLNVKNNGKFKILLEKRWRARNAKLINESRQKYLTFRYDEAIIASTPTNNNDTTRKY